MSDRAFCGVGRDRRRDRDRDRRVRDRRRARTRTRRRRSGPGLVTVDVDIHYSKFSMSTLQVREGTTVRFLVRNHDPIAHEFIVGDAAVHAAPPARHRPGAPPGAG